MWWWWWNVWIYCWKLLLWIKIPNDRLRCKKRSPQSQPLKPTSPENEVQFPWSVPFNFTKRESPSLFYTRVLCRSIHLKKTGQQSNFRCKYKMQTKMLVVYADDKKWHHWICKSFLRWITHTLIDFNVISKSSYKDLQTLILQPQFSIQNPTVYYSRVTRRNGLPPGWGFIGRLEPKSISPQPEVD